MIFPRTSHAHRARALGALALPLALAALAGCGSGGSGTITVGNENKADESIAKASGSSSSATSPSATTTTAKTPSSGPLSKEPTVTPPSGAAPTALVSKDLVKGTGAEAKLGSSITVNYVGVLYKGGKVFDASWKRGEPTTFTLEQGKLIAGWTQGIPGMKVGGRRELIIPAALAYGAKGSPPSIPPNAPLVFVIDLLGV
ncbi:MAG TPA: FKBP-type peptidyl-prolyl cis-trans isomerase [Solirubrobacteraceae bacterium]|nr:FKBP-type peptidyl-prolyl cis-trans isomerase [Solirubrobacteraceae bacterium]